MTCKDCYHYDVCHRRINRIDFLPIINGEITRIPIMFIKCKKVKNIIFDTDGIAFDERAIGKTVFLSKKEAEKVLEGK